MSGIRGSKLARYWGYLPLLVIILSLGTTGLGDTMYLVLMGLLLLYVLFQAPVWCGAVNRRRGTAVEYCRNNSAGLLLGCSRVREHKMQKLKTIWWAARWRQNTHGLWAGPAAKFALVSGLVGMVTGVWGIIAN